MKTAGLLHQIHVIVIYLLQMIAPSSEQFTVNALKGPILAPLGGEVALSCHLSPPQNAQHMEIRWFRNQYTQPVRLYRDGKDLHGETISNYVERTELLKDAIEEGKVTLRILNVSVDDDGLYHCVFKDGDFYEEDLTEVKVTATSLDIQIAVHPPTTKGLIVECHSRGWFPRPQMAWRGSRGETVPPTSTSHSEDKEKLFDVKMTLLLNDSSQRDITCCLRNPLTGQEERASIVLPGELFAWNFMWKVIIITCMAVLLFSVIMPTIELHCRRKGRFCSCNSPCVMGATIIIVSLTANLIIVFYFFNEERESPRMKHTLKEIYAPDKTMTSVNFPVSDPLFELDAVWIEDMSIVLTVLLVFTMMLVSLVYFRLRDYLQSQTTEQASNVLPGVVEENMLT